MSYFIRMYISHNIFIYLSMLSCSMELYFETDIRIIFAGAYQVNHQPFLFLIAAQIILCTYCRELKKGLIFIALSLLCVDRKLIFITYIARYLLKGSWFVSHSLERKHKYHHRRISKSSSLCPEGKLTDIYHRFAMKEESSWKVDVD